MFGQAWSEHLNNSYSDRVIDEQHDSIDGSPKADDREEVKNAIDSHHQINCVDNHAHDRRGEDAPESFAGRETNI